MTSSPPTNLSLAVLLVDDDPDARMMVRDALDAHPGALDVREVANGEEAMDFLYRRGAFADVPRPGLIYMDVEMPGMGGQAALAAIRKDPALADIPIVMMTSVDDDGQKRLAAANGANSYTLKPFDAETLTANVLAATAYWSSIHRRPETEIFHA